MAARKRPQNNVDRAIAALSADQQQEFREFCRQNPPYRDVQSWLADLGHAGVSVASISNWFTREFPVGHEAAAVNAIAATFAGADERAILRYGLGVAVHLTDKLFNHLTDELVEGLNASGSLYQLNLLLKESRSAAIALQSFEARSQRAELELAGGYRMAELLRNLAKDANQVQLIDDLITAALVKFEEEIN